MKLKLLLALKLWLVSLSLAMSVEASNQKLPQVQTPHKEKELQETLSTSFHNWSTLFSVIITGGAAIFAVRQYHKGEEWKKLEYLDNKFKEFESKSETVNIRKMLLNEIQIVELFPLATQPQDRFVNISYDQLKQALQEGIDKSVTSAELQIALNKVKEPKHPCKKETVLVKAAIRDNFNRFLQDLEQFELMAQSHTIERTNLEKYLKPWAKIIDNINNGKACGVECRKTVLEYMGLEGDKLSPLQKNIKDLLVVYYKQEPQRLKT